MCNYHVQARLRVRETEMGARMKLVCMQTGPENESRGIAPGRGTGVRQTPTRRRTTHACME